MSEEEIIKEIKIIKDLQDIMQHDLDVYPPKEDIYELDTKQLKAVLSLLDLYNKEKEKNKELEENYKRLQNTEAVKEYYLPKKKIKEILKQRLKKYQEDDDGEYKQEYLTRGELELVDRYKECSELLKILCEEDIYKIELDYIPKSKIKEKIKMLEKLQNEFKNNEELRIKIIAYKELLKGE